MNSRTSVRIALLMTGNELMTGDIVDSNAKRVAEAFLPLGLMVEQKSTVGDRLDLLVSEMQRLSQSADVLLVNGGLGPTSDDLTAAALAEVMGCALVEHPDAVSHLEQWCVARGFALSRANRKQALLPEGVALIPNAVGSAVGFSATVNDCLILCTPGVPSELERMLSDEIVSLLQQRLPGESQFKRVRLRIFGYGEAGLQQILSDHLAQWPPQIELGFRASMPLLELKLQASRQQDFALLEQLRQQVENLLGPHVVGENECRMAEVLVSLLQENGLKVCTAESCTGGMIASLITQVSGASQVFEAGWVTYANSIKEQELGVSAATLEREGAVSEAVVRQMLQGALVRSGADLGVAVSGIAGPGGGTPDKPVGLVWLAWGSREQQQARAFYLPGNRQRFQVWVANLAMDLLRRQVLGTPEEPIYFIERQPPQSKPQ
ncbi:MAG: CinA family nicotinamide mononucleotide deamidase-related protein [Oleiphilaceae bacterium]|nr:CinA family nicotinamide mononucleotide deamidase-related protein [Oleiphilaceae bacterium]